MRPAELGIMTAGGPRAYLVQSGGRERGLMMAALAVASKQAHVVRRGSCSELGIGYHVRGCNEERVEEFEPG